MRIAEFDYILPDDLIAQQPVSPRDASRLMVLHRGMGDIEHRHFNNINEYLRTGDLLVMNDTRVIPARLLGRKTGTGGQAEVLLLKQLGPERWEGLVRPGRRLQPGATIIFGNDELQARIIDTSEGGSRIIQLSPGPNATDAAVRDLLYRLGELPLPPYITRGPEPSQREVYQTIYASEEGSSAAPTAGLHFTESIFKALAARGVRRAYVTLHIGPGTFRPVQVEDIEEHEMHEEWFSVSPEAASLINSTREQGGRIVAVGTTSTRTLESAADADGVVQPISGPTRLYITPGFRFSVVDLLLTNFHMPRSTLLLLISAFAGRDLVMHAYHEAVNDRYRFLSFGDAMLIV